MDPTVSLCKWEKCILSWVRFFVCQIITCLLSNHLKVFAYRTVHHMMLKKQLQNVENNERGSLMTREIIVGVLALQGAFYEHIKLLRDASIELEPSPDAKWEFIEVRNPSDLAKCDALIIPGGESTTVSLVAERSNLLDPLREFVKYVCIAEACMLVLYVSGTWLTTYLSISSESPKSRFGELAQD